MMLSVWQGGDAFPSCLCHQSQRSLYFPFFASTSIHTLTPARKRAAMPWYVSALCEMNGGSVSPCTCSRAAGADAGAGEGDTRKYIYTCSQIFYKNQCLGSLEKMRCFCYDEDTKGKAPIGRLLLHDLRINRSRLEAGRLFLFYGNDIASDEHQN